MNTNRIRKITVLLAERDAIDARLTKMASSFAGNGHAVKPRILAATPIKVTRSTNGKLLKLRRLQGRYLGAVRPLTKTQRKQVSKIREASGYIKAIAKAKQLQK